MAGYTGVITKERKPIWEVFKDDWKANKDPDFFQPTGTQVYVGRQGSGKTISAVHHALKIKYTYPKSILVTNLSLKPNTGLRPVHFSTKEDLQKILAHSKFNPAKHYIQFSSIDELHIALTNVNNEFFGVLYLIDEIHTYFNSLESKNTPMHIFTEISQQRKQRKCIVGTSQLFDRMSKPFREQCDNIIVCSTRFGKLTSQVAFDGETMEKDYDGRYVGNIRRRGYFWHTRFIRNAYDTYQKVVSADIQLEELKRSENDSKPRGRKKTRSVKS
jgi:hypothetical protein